MKSLKRSTSQYSQFFQKFMLDYVTGLPLTIRLKKSVYPIYFLFSKASLPRSRKSTNLLTLVS